ncbi:hypothetical protein [Arthrobacter sp. EM1]|uniref:hypothetical protein n=1 Tax=Arthrobacter sp. EM1 TaxID=3043847 RepID=UPI00249E60A4|nr:hypothetical protein [Arthrobacter sp. EM1]MCB5283390.1 hypothetical protein [Arthrobacter sp. ES1]WGZ80787.1 hypothetical protein QI450_06255 [Arthrobacter sp. EM1]
MREPLLVLSGGSLVALAMAAGLIANRPSLRRNHDDRGRQRRQLSLATCALLASVGLYIVLVPGAGIVSTGTGTSVELGLGMLLLARIWFIFRREVVRYQLWVAAAVYGIQMPAEPAQVRAAETVGAWFRGVLFVAGMSIILLRFIFR